MITRPSTEADRLAWNKALAFADIAWMSEMRVWDADEKWLWPNLPFMLRLLGEERVERYGGVDPGKDVDNDFAAVLVRRFDAAGAESADTREAPLVSAEWYPVDVERGDAKRIVHAARSDEFIVHLGDRSGSSRGKLKVWLIYADFLGHLVPRSWPQTPEYAGGILSYFELDWEQSPGRPLRANIRNTKPPAATGFDWERWVRRPPESHRSTATFRLSNR
jgi:hypothetical protein